MIFALWNERCFVISCISFFGVIPLNLSHVSFHVKCTRLRKWDNGYVHCCLDTRYEKTYVATYHEKISCYIAYSCISIYKTNYNISSIILLIVWNHHIIITSFIKLKVIMNLSYTSIYNALHTSNSTKFVMIASFVHNKILRKCSNIF